MATKRKNIKNNQTGDKPVSHPTSRERYLYLAEKWLHGQLTEVEELEFNAWYDQIDPTGIGDHAESTVPVHTHDTIELDSDYATSEDQLKKRLFDQIRQQAEISKHTDTKKPAPLASDQSAPNKNTMVSKDKNVTKMAGQVTITDNQADDEANMTVNETNVKDKSFQNKGAFKDRTTFKFHLIFSKKAAIFLFGIIGLSILIYYGRHSIQAPITILHHPTPKTDVLPGREKAVLTLASGRRLFLDNTLRGILATQGNLNITASSDGGLIYKMAGDNNDLAQQSAPKARSFYTTGSESNLDGMDSNLFNNLHSSKGNDQKKLIPPLRDQAIAKLEVLNTLSTPKGANYHLILSDGTKVWLNAASSISFPVQFTGKERSVKIKGEAYFEVAKNAAKPFKVTVENMEVKVLGTHFNINAYKDISTINTTLLEGAVQVRDLSTGSAENIVPGQQAKLYPMGKIKVAAANTALAIAWKNGLFQFEKADLHTLLNEVARWYNIQVIWAANGNGKGVGNDASTEKSDLFTGTIPRNLKLSELLAVLDYSNVKFKLEDNKLSVYN